MRRTLLPLLAALLVVLATTALYSPAQVSSIVVDTVQSNAAEAPSYTTHKVTVTSDCRLDDHMAVEVKCGVTGAVVVSPRTEGVVIDSTPPDCVTEYTLTNVCQRLSGGTADDIVRVYDRDRNAAAVRQSVTVNENVSLISFAFAGLDPSAFGTTPYDPGLYAYAVGGNGVYTWRADCDDDPGTSGGDPDGATGFETAFAETGPFLVTLAGPTGECPAFAAAGLHRIRLRAKQAGTTCPDPLCNDLDLFVTASTPAVEIAEFTPSATSGTDPLDDVSFVFSLSLPPATTLIGTDTVDLALTCSADTEAACGTTDTDCIDDNDGCCWLPDQMVGTLMNVGVDTAGTFYCDYGTGGIGNGPGVFAAKAVVTGTGATSSRTVSIPVGAAPWFGFAPNVSPTTDHVGDTFTMNNPFCTGTATGVITGVTINWEHPTGTVEPYTAGLLANCTWNGASPTHVYTTSGLKTVRITGTRGNVQDTGDQTIQVDPNLTLGAAITLDVASGPAVLAVVPTITFSGTCTPRVVTNASCGAFCTGGTSLNTGPAGTNNPTVVGACSCFEGVSTPRIDVSCAGAPSITNLQGPTINVGPAPVFNIVPVPSATIATANGSGITLTTTCSGDVTGAITAVAADGYGITMEDGVDPLVDATWSGTTCTLTSSHAKTYTTPGQKTIRVCALRSGVASCNTATVTVEPADTLGGTMTADPASGVNGSLTGVDFDFVMTGTCTGPWVVSNGDCGAFGTPTNGGLNDVSVVGSFSLDDRCTFTTGSSTPSATISCGSANPIIVQSPAVVVTDPTGATFELNLTAVPLVSFVADQECDANGCYARVDISTTCSGTANGYIDTWGAEGNTDITYGPPQPTLPVGQGWYGAPVHFNQDCTSDINWAPDGKPFPPGTWSFTVCGQRQVTGGYNPDAPRLTDCDEATFTVTAGTAAPIFNLYGTATGSVTSGTPEYANQPPMLPAVTLQNDGTGPGSYTCTTIPSSPMLLSDTQPFKSMQATGWDAPSSSWKGALNPGAFATFLWQPDHRGIDQVAGTSDDTDAGTHQATLRCTNDQNGSNIVQNVATFTVASSAYADLETTGTGTLNFTVIEGVTPSSQYIELYSVGGLAAPFTITNPTQSPITFVTCTLAGGSQTGGTAPVDPARLRYTCTPTSGMTYGQGPFTTTKTFTRTQ